MWDSLFPLDGSSGTTDIQSRAVFCCNFAGYSAFRPPRSAFISGNEDLFVDPIRTGPEIPNLHLMLMLMLMLMAMART